MSDVLKQQVAKAALDYVGDHRIIGVGTGSTVNYFIDALATFPHRIEACVASSVATRDRLLAHGLMVLDLNLVDGVAVYIDGADEINYKHQMIKGGGGALTREKIVASDAECFVCMVDERKWRPYLGDYPVAIEVLPLARSVVARALVQLGGEPVYRQGMVTDNGNIILDTYHLNPERFLELEAEINNIPGVVENGLFIKRTADVVLIASRTGIKTSTIK